MADKKNFPGQAAVPAAAERVVPGRSRGRPRAFDLERAVAQAQALFHARGYDGVGVAEITRALGINPPSFYAAFGSKAGLFDQAVQRYVRTGALPLAELLTDDRPVAAALGAVLAVAAERYAADPDALGCLVIESARSGALETCPAAAESYNGTAALIRAYVAARHPDQADRIRDFVLTTMAGLSAAARGGMSAARLKAVAEVAAAGLAASLGGVALSDAAGSASS